MTLKRTFVAPTRFRLIFTIAISAVAVASWFFQTNQAFYSNPMHQRWEFINRATADNSDHDGYPITPIALRYSYSGHQAARIWPAIDVGEFDETNDEFQSTIQPIMQRYCADCHQGELAEGIFDIEQFKTLKNLNDGLDVWEKVTEQVRENIMPPADAASIPDDQKKQFLNWSDRVLAARPGRPGTITLRRLTRYEYRNTVRDLLGVDYPLADDFPADDVGYGFDNIGDVLSLPPLLMEKYLAAAETVSEKAIVDLQSLQIDQALDITEFAGTRGAVENGNGFVMTTNGRLSKSIRAKARGKYSLVVTAAAQQAGDEPAKMSVFVGDEKIKTVDVPNEVDKLDAYEFAFDAPKGRMQISVSFDNDFYVPATNERPGQDRNLHIAGVHIKGPEKIDDRDLPENYAVLYGDAKTPEERIERLIKRAYRRPATPSEIERLKMFYQHAVQDTNNNSIAMRLVLQAILVSPHFLFKVEEPVPNDGSVRNLNDYEIASGLSYFLWRTMPDDQLFALAEANQLGDPAVVQSQVDRMLADPKAKSLCIDFADQWFNLRLLEDVSPDPELFPEFDDQLREDMRVETRMLFEHVLENDLSVLELLSARYTFVNERLGKLYGIEGVSGSEFQKVELDGTGRAGVLTHAGILTLTSNPNRTSPVKRGKWVLEAILGQEPPPPDPNVSPLESQGQLTGTLRERMEQHRADPTCAVCHQRMDPIGFAMENYDAVGRWRDNESGQPIDVMGKLPNGLSFNGAQELSDMFVQQYRDQFVQSLTKKMLTYALGRGLEYYDRPAVDRIVKSMGEKNWTMRSLIHGIVQSEPFLKRQKIDEKK
jgi:hypothetical protein